MSQIIVHLFFKKLKRKYRVITERKEGKLGIRKLHLILVLICFSGVVSHHSDVANQGHSDIVTHGQANLIPWNENRPLQWYDFCGKVNDTSGFDAQCFAEVSYVYKFKSPQDFQFAVFADFNKNKSWVRKECQSEDLLRHERLHFDIAEILAMRVKEVFHNYNYTEDFKAEIQWLFNITKLEYDLLQHQYDMETDHSLNKKKQKEWEGYISNELTRINLKQKIARTDVIETEKTE